MFVLRDLTRVAWHGKEEERSQMIGWDPKMEVGTPSHQRKKIIRKLVVGQGSWQTEPKPVLWVEEDKKKSILDTKEPSSSSQY